MPRPLRGTPKVQYASEHSCVVEDNRVRQGRQWHVRFRLVCLCVVILVHMGLAGQEGINAYLAALWTTQTHIPAFWWGLMNP